MPKIFVNGQFYIVQLITKNVVTIFFEHSVDRSGYFAGQSPVSLAHLSYIAKFLVKILKHAI